MKRLVLVYEHPELGEQRFKLETGKAYTIGSRLDNDIALPQQDVSRRHAKLVVGPGSIRVTDLGSKNGTWVAGRRVTTAEVACGEPVMLSSATFVVMEMSSGNFRIAPEIEPQAPRRQRPPSSDTVHNVQQSGPGEFVELIERTEEAVEKMSAGPVLEWAVDRTDARGALVVAVREEGVFGVESSTGEVDRLLLDPARLESLSAEVIDPDPSAGRESGGIAFQEDVMAVRVDRHHILILQLSEAPPADLELRALRAAMRTVLSRISGALPSRRAPSSGDSAGANDEDEESVPEVIGRSSAFVGVVGRARQYALQEEPVLLLGESGTGKELLARLIHERSSRRSGPFVAVNCAAIPADLIEAELFGVRRGAATGVGERLGKFQAADGGTFFLDEIGDLPLGLQGKLLRVLDAGEFFRVGDDAPRRCSVRIVSATNRDLTTAVEAGRFRADLFYRLHVFTLQIPPLRDRRDDIPLLVNYFLEKVGERMGRRVRGCTVKALRALTAYEWPGNVRELRSEVTRIMAAVVDGAVIDVDHLSTEVATAAGEVSGSENPERFSGLPLAEAVAVFEGVLIRRALETCRGNRTRAAKELGLTRAGLFKKMRRLGLIEKQQPSESTESQG